MNMMYRSITSLSYTIHVRVTAIIVSTVRTKGTCHTLERSGNIKAFRSNLHLVRFAGTLVDYKENRSAVWSSTVCYIVMNKGN